MKIAVIGAGRRRNGIGAYSARFARAEGARVVAVLAQDEDSARRDAQGLQEFGIRADAYADFDALVNAQQPDAVIIASPAATHADYLDRAVAAGLHVLCEKPFIWDGGCDYRQAARLLEAARARGLTIAMNSQWPFVLPAYKQLCALPPAERIESFYIQLAPLATGRDMIADAMPHALSLLYCVLGAGELEQIHLLGSPGNISLAFDYVTESTRCRVTAELVHEITQPRSFAFGFNNLIARRTIDMASYSIAFTHGDRRIEVQDPLQLSVRNFMYASMHKVSPEIDGRHIVETMKVLQQLYAAWPGEHLTKKE